MYVISVNQTQRLPVVPQPFPNSLALVATEPSLRWGTVTPPVLQNLRHLQRDKLCWSSLSLTINLLQESPSTFTTTPQTLIWSWPVLAPNRSTLWPGIKVQHLFTVLSIWRVLIRRLVSLLTPVTTYTSDPCGWKTKAHISAGSKESWLQRSDWGCICAWDVCVRSRTQSLSMRYKLYLFAMLAFLLCFSSLW